MDELAYDADLYLLELRRYRALAALRMYEGLLRTLAGYPCTEADEEVHASPR